MRLPLFSLLLTLAALASMVLVRSFAVTLSMAGGVLLLQSLLIILRIIISGRAPITNMYETVLFSGYGALILALIIGHLKKEQIFVYLGLAYNACTLMMLNFADGMLSEEINPPRSGSAGQFLALHPRHHSHPLLRRPCPLLDSGQYGSVQKALF